MTYLGHPHQIFGPNTYSQHGEDLFLLNLAHLLGLDKPSYLDLGAYHPVHISNTALLYFNGSRGVNVEANPVLIDTFNRLRPEDKNISVGVSLVNGYQYFHMESELSVLNSFKEESFSNHNVKPTKSIKIKTMTLNDLINEYCGCTYPDFLLMDIEGLDYDVLASAHFYETKPKVICAEIRKDEAEATLSLLNAKGYTFLCRIVSNMIFVQGHLYSKCI